MIEFFDYELTHFMQGTAKAIEESINKKEIIDFEGVEAYLAKNPFTAEETASNSEAYERLMDSRCKLYVSLRITVLH